MTAYSPPLNRTFNGPRMIVILGFFIALIVAIPCVHAVKRHGDDALAVRQCVSSGHTLNYLARREQNKYYLLCQLPDGRWGLQIVKKLGKVLQEVTSFIPGDGSWDEASQYVERLATRYRGGL
jgi:putative hemolysin